MAWTEEDDQTLRELAEQGYSVRAIADRLGKGKSIVSTHARDIGVVFDRAQVAKAVEAAKVDGKARRALLAARMLDEAEHALDRIHEPYEFVAATKDGIETRTLDQPDAASHRNFMTSAAVAVDKHVALERVDTDGGRDQAVSVLEQLVLAAGIPRTAADAPDPDDTGTGVDDGSPDDADG